MENQPILIIPNDMVSTLPDNSGVKYVLPVNVSGWVVAAGYLGLLSFTTFFAILSIIISFLAFQD